MKVTLPSDAAIMSAVLTACESGDAVWTHEAREITHAIKTLLVTGKFDAETDTNVQV